MGKTVRAALIPDRGTAHSIAQPRGVSRNDRYTSPRAHSTTGGRRVSRNDPVPGRQEEVAATLAGWASELAGWASESAGASSSR